MKIQRAISISFIIFLPLLFGCPCEELDSPYLPIDDIELSHFDFSGMELKEYKSGSKAVNRYAYVLGVKPIVNEAIRKGYKWYVTDTIKYLRIYYGETFFGVTNDVTDSFKILPNRKNEQSERKLSENTSLNFDNGAVYDFALLSGMYGGMCRFIVEITFINGKVIKHSDWVLLN